MLSIAVMLILFVPMFGIKALPKDVQAAIISAVVGGNVRVLLAGLALALLAVDAALLSAGMMRFQRSRLSLD